jgi:Leucine-rich repeat (LRR) protein
MKPICAILLFYIIANVSLMAESWVEVSLRIRQPEKTWKLYADLPLSSHSFVRAISLKGKQLKSIPIDLAKFTNLEYLDLSSNDLVMSDDDWKILSELKKIEILNLSSNKISSLSPKLSNLSNLTHLAIGKNEIKGIDSSISLMDNLIYVDLNGNLFTEVPTWLASNKNIQVLNVSQCKIKTCTEGRYPSLKCLLINNNELSNDSLSSFPTSLQEVSLSSNKITKFSLSKSPPDIKVINISGNGLESIDYAGRSDVTVIK